MRHEASDSQRAGSPFRALIARLRFTGLAGAVHDPTSYQGRRYLQMAIIVRTWARRNARGELKQVLSHAAAVLAVLDRAGGHDGDHFVAALADAEARARTVLARLDTLRDDYPELFCEKDDACW